MKKAARKWLKSSSNLVARLLAIVPAASSVDWACVYAARWQNEPLKRRYQTMSGRGDLRLEDLLAIDAQKLALQRNTLQFLQGLPANNALLWGARGTGKSSLIQALLNTYADDGLRVVEVSRLALADLAALAEELSAQPYKFLLYCDDLSFEREDASFKALKSALEGSILRDAENLLIYATSNRRHLVPETMRDNQNAKLVNGELHPDEAVEEKISLSDRFGLWLSFYPFKQDAYLSVARHWVKRLAQGHEVAGLQDALESEAFAKQAAAWALGRGVRSGRTAEHFARHWLGEMLVDQR